MNSYLTTLLLLLFVTCAPSENNDMKNYMKNWTEQDREYLLSGLENSFNNILKEINDLDDDQWHRKEGNDWSIAMIIEHLIIHDELFFREIRSISALPALPLQPDSLFAGDEAISSYAEITSDNIGKAPDYMDPQGRWRSKQDAIQGYHRARSALIDFIKSYRGNLRSYYTKGGRGPTEYRDLHQLMLVSIAHTERHLQQIKGIKAHR